MEINAPSSPSNPCTNCIYPFIPQGFFYEPTVLSVRPGKHEIWTSEVFGPVLAVAAFDSEAEAVRLANASQYGLAAAVLSADGDRCKRVAAALEAGIIWVNCSQPCFADVPWGGFKRSGVGRELGEHGLFNSLPWPSLPFPGLL